MNEEKLQQIIGFVLFTVSMTIMIYLVLSPTFLPMSLLERLTASIIFSCNFFLAILGGRAILKLDSEREKVVGLSLVVLIVHLTTLIVLFVFQQRSLLCPFWFSGFPWYLFILWFYTRPKAKNLL